MPGLLQNVPLHQHVQCRQLVSSAETQPADVFCPTCRVLSIPPVGNQDLNTGFGVIVFVKTRGILASGF